MYEYITGLLTDLTPSYAVIETKDGVGWLINISLSTFSQIEGKKECKLFVFHIQREDSQTLFGFFDKTEREVFKMLLDVSGIGPNTARVILSSMSVAELQSAISREDSKMISRVKGIGAKTAQRLVIDLKDKIQKIGISDISVSGIQAIGNSEQRDEAVSALIMLGYPKTQAEKGADMALKQNPGMSAEDIIKFALRNVK
ncbi:MAG: Holliday junction branch migration protein RuvA [Bacteroidales bacterium]|nr:Holliday junction branch migration protein RuvA [Bacteroidales bacterium]